MDDPTQTCSPASKQPVLYISGSVYHFAFISSPSIITRSTRDHTSSEGLRASFVALWYSSLTARELSSMSMSMSTSASAMASMSATATSAAASATTSAASGHSHGSMDAGGNACKINMLWNWYTIDACFLSQSWQIKSNAMFAATCIGVTALVVVLELCRRLGKEYDALIVRQFKRNLNARAAAVRVPPVDSSGRYETPFATFRATPLQQCIRSLIHAVVFGLAYIVMLLAMYYNGFVLISIVIGAGVGKFLCDWMVVKIPFSAQYADMSGKNINHQIEEPSVCCG